MTVLYIYIYIYETRHILNKNNSTFVSIVRGHQLLYFCFWNLITQKDFILCTKILCIKEFVLCYSLKKWRIHKKMYGYTNNEQQQEAYQQRTWNGIKSNNVRCKTFIATHVITMETILKYILFHIFIHRISKKLI